MMQTDERTRQIEWRSQLMLGRHGRTPVTIVLAASHLARDNGLR
jgi:hypothetical protein